MARLAKCSVWSLISRQAFSGVLRRQSLVIQLTQREILGRYRGSALGVLWSLLTPLFMLAVYTFVFGAIFKAHWTTSSDTSTGEFAIVLFAGLIVFQLFAEVVNRAPTLILSNVNYVKRVVFPLEILPVVATGSALFHAGVNITVMLAFLLISTHHIPLMALWLPVVLFPLLILTIGVGWLLAALGVFFRDVSQFISTVVTALMFLSPIFYPVSALPDWMRPWLFLNPLALPIEQVRAVAILNSAPNWSALALYTVVAVVIAMLGWFFFQKTRKGFADVL